MQLLQLRTTLKLCIWEANSEAFTFLPVFFHVQNMSTRSFFAFWEKATAFEQVWIVADMSQV